MNRTTYDVHQGTGPWLRLREGFFTASEAPAALGVSKYVPRTALLRRKHTGIAEEHSPETLAKFRAGHDAEAGARPMAEAIVKAELFPVTMSVEIDGLRLLASLDGMTMDDEVVWETKLWNDDLAAEVREGKLSEHYAVQLDQELLVTGAKRCLFTCTDGTPERFVSCWYEPKPERFSALIAGWQQFAADLAAYVLPDAPDPAPVGKAPDTLPALRIEVTGQVTASNLAEFKQTALAAIRSVNRDLATDQDFADAEKAVKWCEDVEGRLKAAKEHALSQTSSIDALFKAIDDISAEARRVRLDLDKLVTRRKTEVKEEAVDRARKAFDMHVAVIHAEIAPMRLPIWLPDFAGAIKGKRSIASMQDALDTTLADAKIKADGAARLIRSNVNTFKQEAAGFEFLFPDLGSVISKDTDHFQMLVQSRIAAHQAAEAKRLEAERERIRREEEERAARKAEDARAPAAPITPNAQEGLFVLGTPSPYAGNVAQAAQATPSGAGSGAHAEERAPEPPIDIVLRLRTSPPNVLLQREAADEIERLRRRIETPVMMSARAA